MKTRLITALLACVLAASAALAQDPTGAIEGVVTDPSAAVIAGARVAARNLDTGFTRETITGADGFYRLLLLPVGRYALTVAVRPDASICTLTRTVWLTFTWIASRTAGAKRGASTVTAYRPTGSRSRR